MRLLCAFLLLGLCGAQECELSGCHNAVGDSCEYCLPGTFRDATGACAPCAAGTFQAQYLLTDAPCAPCTRGTYAATQGASACLACAPRHIAAEEGSTTCAECPPQSQVTQNASSCECDAGYLTLWTELGQKCLPCGPQQDVPSFTDENGTCRLCTEGQENQYRQVACAQDRDAVWLPCTVCTGHTVRACTARGGDALCLRACDAALEILEGKQCACVAGHHRPPGTAQYGYTNAFESLEGAACEPCAAGTYFDQAAKQCVACAGPRNYTARAGSAECDVCFAGEMAWPNRTGCSAQCVENRVLQWVDEELACVPCPQYSEASAGRCIASQLPTAPCLLSG